MLGKEMPELFDKIKAGVFTLNPPTEQEKDGPRQGIRKTSYLGARGLFVTEEQARLFINRAFA